jgi:dUTP pyrophosphatase
MVPDIQVAVKLVGPVVVPLPSYQTPGSAGMDLHAALGAPITIDPMGHAKIPTGIAISIPAKFEGQVRPRSGLAAMHGITVLNAPGTIDSDFRGEIQVVLVNFGTSPVTIAPLARIAQLIIAPFARAELAVVEELDQTSRGSGGYGSTG